MIMVCCNLSCFDRFFMKSKSCIFGYVLEITNTLLPKVVIVLTNKFQGNAYLSSF